MLGYGLEALGLSLLPVGELMPSTWHADWLVATYNMLAWVGGTFFGLSGKFRANDSSRH
jgi:hypothetical protein